MGVDAVMAVRIPSPNPPLSAERLLDLSWRLSGAFWREPFWIDGERHCLTEATDPEEWAVPSLSGQLLRVHLTGRYYGPGYERGDAPQLCAIAAWLEANIPDCLVYYGGDSGDRLEDFGSVEREALLAHFYAKGHLPYMGGWSSAFRGIGEPPQCMLCQKPMLENGGGPELVFYECYGCPEKAITDKCAEVLERWRGREDFFKVAQRLRDAQARADA